MLKDGFILTLLLDFYMENLFFFFLNTFQSQGHSSSKCLFTICAQLFSTLFDW